MLVSGIAGAQSFTTPALYPAQNGPIPAATADFNGDGKPDIAVGNAGSSSVSIYLGTGTGNFTVASSVAIPNECTVGFLFAGDFNQDGKVDLLAACMYQTTVWVLPGQGQGQFGAPVSTSLPAIAYFGFQESNSQTITVADFNNDHKLDLVIGLYNAAGKSLDVSLMLGNGDGTFTAPSIISVDSSFELTSVVLSADFDGDGDQDLAVGAVSTTNGASAFEILHGNGNGTFTELPHLVILASRSVVESAVIADVNRDGIPDLVAAEGTGPSTPAPLLQVFTGKGDGTFSLSFSGPDSALVIGFLAVDLFGSGTPDLVELLYPAEELETVVPPVHPIGRVPAPQASFAPLSVAVRAGNGDGTFQSPVGLAFPNSLQPGVYGLVAGDWNGDGITDLAFSSLPASVDYLNFGSSGGSIATIDSAIVSGLQSLPAGDLVVMLNTTTPTSTLALSSTQLQFTYVAGGATPASQTVNVSNKGNGALNWTASPAASWLNVAPASGTAPAILTISVNPSGLTAGAYTSSINVTAAGSGSSPQAISVTLAVSAATNGPVITAVVNGASFLPDFESGSWVTIEGSNLSNTNPGRTWTPSEIVNGNLPESLDGTSVMIDGKPAYVYYISPTQLNVQAPTDSATGTVSVVVTNNSQVSAAFNAQLSTYSPAFFLYTGTSYAIASHFPDYGLVGNPNAIPGTIAAHPGDVLILWTTGFGPTNPATPAGIVVTGAPAAATLPVVTVGGMPVSVISAVLSPGSAGLYQVAIQLPATVPTGVVAIQASIMGATSPANTMTYVASH
ncbi:MAG TPA: FG-GAP-like repeat-containing protein [Bryobacteraceae bacterium]|nr:FG-GAP-like repeat-containing protein [Bryobacteraceae bacterium]